MTADGGGGTAWRRHGWDVGQERTGRAGSGVRGGKAPRRRRGRGRRGQGVAAILQGGRGGSWDRRGSKSKTSEADDAQPQVRH